MSTATAGTGAGAGAGAGGRNGNAGAPAAPAANAAKGPSVAERLKAMGAGIGASQWVAFAMFIVGIAFLIANLGYMAQIAGSSDTWDTVKTQLGGAAAMAFIGALGFMIALLLYFRSFNVDTPVYILTVLACFAIAASLTALSVAAITR
jgi:hypothetical protein